jgi:hypothetical protein
MENEQTEEETAKDEKMEDETEVEKWTAMTLHRKLEINIPINKTVRHLPNFHIHVPAFTLYSQITITGECGNRERGRAVSLLGTHKSDLHCNVELNGIEGTEEESKEQEGTC